MDFERFSIVVSFETTRIEMNPVVQNFLDVWESYEGIEGSILYVIVIFSSEIFEY